MIFAGLLAVACAASGDRAASPREGPRVVVSEPIDLAALRPDLDLDSLTASLGARADTLPQNALFGLEAEIRDWLAQLEFEDPVLLPIAERHPRRFFRDYRGRLLDALGRAAFRRGDLRQAEAAFVSAVAEINSRGTTSGYARHFHHLGELHAARGRWSEAVEAFLDAEVRGMGEAATPALERAYRRRHGSLRGLDELRARELARVEDERRQRLVEGAERRPLGSFAWPRRTGAPLASGELHGRPLVVAVWGEGCPDCARWGDELGPLSRALAARGATLLAVWLGDDPALAGPPRPYTIVVPPDPFEARRGLDVTRLPTLLVVDARGRIRYRHAGPAADPPPVGDIVVQVDHLRRVAP